MSLMTEWKQSFANVLTQALGREVRVEEIQTPPDTTLGDLAFPCFRDAKTAGVPPQELANRLASLGVSSELFFSFQAAGPYVNATLVASRVTQDVIHRVRHLSGGQFLQHPAQDRASFTFEYANPNTHKEIHIGHLRNFVTGAALVRIWKAAGLPVTPLTFVNDQGANVARTLWWLAREKSVAIREASKEALEAMTVSFSDEQKTGRYLGQVYTEATKVMETVPGAADEVSFIQASLEAHHPGWEWLWIETRNWCVEELNRICADLGVEYEKRYFESDLIDRAQEVVNDLERTGVAKISQGALVVDLEEDKLGVALIRKSDGNLLYISKDLALAELKAKEYPDAERHLILVDKRQHLHFQQLQSILQKLGHTQTFADVGHELVTLKDGAMSSRKGNIVTYQGLREAVDAYAREQIRARHPDWTEEGVAATAKDLAKSGMIFSMLKQGIDKLFVFDMEEALAFEGMTGPYCQYACIRFHSIIEKAKALSASNERASLEDRASKQLAIKLASLPDAVNAAAEAANPALLAVACFELAQEMHAFYRDVPVMDAEPALRTSRLDLVGAAKVVLSGGLLLLGIETPNQM